MKVTNDMLYKAVKQAVREGLLPTSSDMDTYLEHYASVRKVLESALGGVE